VEHRRWARVSGNWLGHRAEPLIHERVWACPLIYHDPSLAPALGGWTLQAGPPDRIARWDARWPAGVPRD